MFVFILFPGVQIIGGILSILSGVVLVLYFAKLDSLIQEKYQHTFGVSILAWDGEWIGDWRMEIGSVKINTV